MEFKEFFKDNGNKIIYGHEDMACVTIEELYQAFKLRLKDEIEVFCSRLTDKNEKL